MKFKTLALVALTVAAAPAFARVLNTAEGDLGTTELVLLVTNANGSYAQDLGTTVNDLAGVLNTTGNFTQSVLGAQWTAFQNYGGVDSTWAVIAVQNVGGGFEVGDSNVWTTVAKTQQLGIIQNVQVTDAAANLGFHFAEIDNRAVNNGFGQANNQVASPVGNPAHTDDVLINLNGTGFRTSNAIGQSSDFVYLGISGEFTDLPASSTLLKNTANSLYSVNFDGNAISFTAAVVPEPSTYAMLMAGLLAVGFVARRRVK